jgi:hypothetical protein
VGGARRGKVSPGKNQ